MVSQNSLKLRQIYVVRSKSKCVKYDELRLQGWYSVVFGTKVLSWLL